MSLRENQAQVTRAMKDLTLQWQRTRESWRDERAREFARAVLAPLANDVSRAADAMDQMAVAIEQARRDCLP